MIDKKFLEAENQMAEPTSRLLKKYVNLLTRAERAESELAERDAYVERLIEAGDRLSDSLCIDPEEEKTVEVMNWNTIVTSGQVPQGIPAGSEMKFGSLFTGVGGFDLGFERAGMECAWQVEFDKACQLVLKKHWSETELFDDVRTVGKHNLEPVDVICGGFPCQDVSIAGKRAGLAGERSGLWSEFARIIDELEPKWVVIENVPGLLSSNRGRDFATVIRWLAERGYGVAWRILDSQYFGVAQRRRRVFIVGSFGSGSASEILFESEGVRWDIEKGRKTGQGTAGTVAPSLTASNDPSRSPQSSEVTSQVGAVHKAAVYRKLAISEYADDGNITSTLAARDYKDATDLICYNIHQNDDGRKDRPSGGLYVNKTDTSLTLSTGQGKSKTLVLNDQGGSVMSVSEDVSATLRAEEHGHQPCVMHSSGFCTEPSSKSRGVGYEEERSPTLRAGVVPGIVLSFEPGAASRVGGHTNGVMTSAVRRLTPTECERLQGFPDGWTDGQADSHRYKQMGNAVTVNVAEWIGKRIAVTK